MQGGFLHVSTSWLHKISIQRVSGLRFRVSRYGLCQTRCRLPELCWLESFHLQVPTLCVCTHDKDACKFGGGGGGRVGVANNKGYLFWGP